MKYQLEKFNLSRSGPFFWTCFFGGSGAEVSKKPSLFSPKKSGWWTSTTTQRSYSIQGPKLHSALLATCEAMNLGFVEGNHVEQLERTTIFTVSRCWLKNHFDLDFCLGEDFHFDKPIYRKPNSTVWIAVFKLAIFLGTARHIRRSREVVIQIVEPQAS